MMSIWARHILQWSKKNGKPARVVCVGQGCGNELRVAVRHADEFREVLRGGDGVR